MSFGLHEGIHLFADGTVPSETFDTPEGKRIKERRGFHVFYFKEDGEDDRKMNWEAQKKTPHQAIDEGAVVFIDMYIKNGKSFNNLDERFAEQFGLKPSYIDAAKVTARLAQVMGVEKLLSNYAHSDLDGWLAQIEQYAGPEGLKKYLEAMTIFQSQMSVYG